MNSKRSQNFFLAALIFLNILIWGIYLNLKKNNLLEVDFLDIGQGDAIFIQAPNGKQMLVDGGPDNSVLSQLGKVMSFFDRSIDIILATHPDKDHVAGLPFVIDNYKVGNFIDSVADSSTAVYTELERRAKEHNIPTYWGKRGMTIILDKQNGVYLEVLYPNEDDFKLTETNDLSIVAKLIYGDTSFMLTGDATKLVENMLDSTDGKYLQSMVLKAGHHGSNTSSSFAFVNMVAPKYAIISAGLHNSYGHPHKETLNTLDKEGAKILETSKEGTIRFFSNGVDVWWK